MALIPDPALRNRSDLYKATTTDASGRYRFQDIAPGDYTLFAWESVESGSWQDALFIDGYKDRGTSVQVTEESSQVIDPTAIPPRTF